MERGGEYAMDMVYPDYFNQWYAYKYYDTYLSPVYEVRAEGVPIFVVFKNDREHSKPELINVEPITRTTIAQQGRVILITLTETAVLSSMTLEYDVPAECQPIRDGSISLSADGMSWKTELDVISVSHGKTNYVPEDKLVERKFAAKPAKYIRIITDMNSQCLLDIKNFAAYHHPDPTVQ